MDKLKIGQILKEEQFKDAIHIAVAPVIAAENLAAGDYVGLNALNEASCNVETTIGIVDPFLQRTVLTGERFWLFLFPGSITSLRHDWTHPQFPEIEQPAQSDKSESEKWMRAWAVNHVSGYGRNEQQAYEFALEAGDTHSIGADEDARDYINGEWWNHWEKITGKAGDRDAYFNCAC